MKTKGPERVRQVFPAFMLGNLRINSFMKFRNILATILLTGSVSQAAVWQDTNQWNEDWENKYAEFVAQNITTDMFTNINSPFYGMPSDCADLTYFARAIFAEQNSLPFVLNTKFSDTKQTISNRTTRFDQVADIVSSVRYRGDNGQMKEVQLPKSLNNGKLRAFLRQMGEDVGTWSLPYDTYPIKVDRDNVRAGVVYLRQGYNRMSALEAIQTFLTGTPPNPKAPPGHALLVQNVRPSGAIDFIQSTLPKKVRDLSQIHEIELLPTNANLGFRRFVQPHQVGKVSRDGFEGYSSEQFTEIGREIYNNSNCGGESYDPSCFNGNNQVRSTRRNITQFRKDVMERLATRAESEDEQNERVVNTLCGAIRQRADVILTAEPNRLAYKGGCMDLNAYDNYSTPSRDEQIRQFIKQLSFWGNKTSKLLAKCGSVKIDYTEKQYSIETLVNNFRKGNYSSNPNEKIAVRWGFESGSSRCSDPKKN